MGWFSVGLKAPDSSPGVMNDRVDLVRGMSAWVSCLQTHRSTSRSFCTCKRNVYLLPAFVHDVFACVKVGDMGLVRAPGRTESEKQPSLAPMMRLRFRPFVVLTLDTVQFASWCLASTVSQRQRIQCMVHPRSVQPGFARRSIHTGRQKSVSQCALAAWQLHCCVCWQRGPHRDVRGKGPSTQVI